MKKQSKILILGSGPAGYTSAIYAARANLNPILITGLEKGGQLCSTNSIENWPGDHQKISGTQLMERMQKHAKKFDTEIIFDYIQKANLQNYPFSLKGENNEYTTNSLIIATGASAKYLGLPEENLFKGKGISTCAVCDGFFYRNQKVAIVGGGNTAVEEALYLANIASEVHLIHRRNTFRAEKILINRLMEKVNSNIIMLHTEKVLEKIIGNKIGINSLILRSTHHTDQIKSIKVSGLFIAIGYKPNTELFKNQLTLKNHYIQIQNHSHYSTATNIKGVFAAGDVSDPTYRQAITAAATGCMAAIDAKRFLETNE